MKILCVVPTYWPAFEFGGPIQSLHLLNKSLVNKGADVTVFTTNKGQSKDTYSNKLINIDGVDVIYFSYSESLDIIGSTGWHFSFPLRNKLDREVKKFDIVYILSVWNFTSIVTAFYCNKYSIPYIISPRGQLYPQVLAVKSWKKVPFYYLFVKRMLNNAISVHYTTQDEYFKVHTRLNLKSEPLVIPNGLDLTEYKELPAKGNFLKRYPHLKGKNIILFLGRLNWKKGIDLVIKSFPDIIRINKNAHFLIVGNDENNYKTELINLINSLNLQYFDFSNKKQGDTVSNQTSITFTGFLDLEDKKEAFVDSDVFILTSHSENFGYVSN